MSGIDSLPLAVVILGLFLVGAVIGADLLRERRERLAVERGLFGEILALRWQAAALAAEITRRHQAKEPFDTAFFALWPLSPPLVYPATGASALGRLRTEAQVRIVHFHGQLAGARARLASAQAAGGFEPSPYRILSGLVRSYNEIDPWLREMRPMLGGSIFQEPDLAAANALLGEFEEGLENTAREPMAVVYCAADCAHP